MPDSADIEVQVNGAPVRVIGWGVRHAACPTIREQFRLCDGKRFRLLFRGVKELPHADNYFIIGHKTRPLYFAGQLSTLEHHARKLASERVLFERLVADFAASRMGSRLDEDVGPKLLNAYERAPEVRPRIRLAQLLLYGLQYQNNRPEVEEWRDYLFVLSASTSPDVAVRYALGHRLAESLPDSAIVIEYAPPCSGHCFERMTDVLSEFAALDLGEWYPDRDNEVLIPCGMLPHFLLGYSTLTRHATAREYAVHYTPNPVYANGGASLECPPNLDAQQSKLMRELNGQVAWTLHVWSDSVGEWCWLHGPNGPQDISGSGPVSGRD